MGSWPCPPSLLPSVIKFVRTIFLFPAPTIFWRKAKKMLKSAVHPKCETGDYNDHGFDLQEDFSQFLEEARRHVRQGNPSPRGDEESGKGRKLSEKEKKSKKSWKTTLFSWWKADKKSSKPPVEEAPCSRISDPRRGHVSGPIYGSSRRTDGRQRRPTSGPISTLFHPTKRAEADFPYVSLNQLTAPHGAHAYGPVYLVT